MISRPIHTQERLKKHGTPIAIQSPATLVGASIRDKPLILQLVGIADNTVAYCLLGQRCWVSTLQAHDSEGLLM